MQVLLIEQPCQWVGGLIIFFPVPVQRHRPFLSNQKILLYLSRLTALGLSHHNYFLGISIFEVLAATLPVLCIDI